MTTQAEDKRTDANATEVPEQEDAPSASLGMSMTEWLRFVFFSAITVVFILNQLDIAETYEIERGISNDILSGDTFTKITNTTDVVDWIQNYLVPKLLVLDYYPYSEDLYDGTYARVAWFNIVTTKLRFVQKRVKLEDNPSDRNNDIAMYSWEVLEFDAFEKSPIGEMSEDYGPLKMFEFNDHIGIGDSGGYQQNLNLTLDEESYTLFRKAMDFLADNNWIDRQTHVLYLDFATYNGHIGMLSYVRILMKISASGAVEKTIMTTSMNVEPYNTSADVIRAVLEAIFVLLSLLYAAIEVYKIKLEVAAKRMEFIEEGSALNTGIFKMIWEGIILHFSSLWNWMDFASVVLSFVIIGLWLQYVSSPLIIDGPGSESLLDQLVEMKAIYERYIGACSINFLLIFIRMLKYLNRFERVGLLQTTFESAKDDIFYFFVLLITVFFAFVIFGYVAFGSNHKDFSQMSSSILTCFFLIFGELDIWFEIRDTHPIEATFFFFLFTFLIVFILVNMFIAIITNFYNGNFDKLEASKKKIAEEDKIHPILQLWNKIKSIVRNMLDYFNKDRRIAKKFAGAEQSLNTAKDEVQARFTEFNLNYKTSIKHKDYIDTEVLTDKEILSKLAEITKSKKAELRSAIIYGIFAITYAVTLIEQIEIGTKYSLMNSVRSAINNVEYQYQNDSYNISNMYNYETFFLWSEQLPTLFTQTGDGDKYVLENYLVGWNMTAESTMFDKGPIRMTLRRNEMKTNPSNHFDEYQEEIRKSSINSFSISGGESEDSFIGGSSGHKYEATSGESFMDLGGFVLYFSADKDIFKEQLDTIKHDVILNDTSASIVYDFVLYNGNSNNVIFAAISFDFSSGGSIDTELFIWPMLLQMYSTPAQIVRAIFEAVYVCLLLYHIVETGIALRAESDSYTSWQRRLYEVLTEEQKRKRNNTQPEWLRRFFSIVDVYLLIDLTAYVLAILSIAAWATYLTQANYGPELPETSTDYFDTTDTLARALKYYLDLSSLNLLLIFLRLLKYMQMSKSLYFLQNTISEALVDIYFFIIMLVDLMLGFVFMGYLAFGTHAQSFSTITLALITSFEMIIGDFDYDEMAAANPEIAPVYFIIYLLLFVFVLLNIFIAILERAYSRVKQESEEERESPVKFITVLIEFCVRRMRQHKEQVDHDLDERTVVIRPEEVFVKMDIGIDGEPDVESWSMRFAEHILMERSKRTQVKSKLDILFKRRKAKDLEGKGFLITSSARNAEKKARLNYWNYLRYGFQSLHSQELVIKREAESIIKDSKRCYERYLHLSKRIDGMLHDVEMQEVELVKVTNEYRSLQSYNE
eukprot:CAMPEP_0204911568 /NCGR_PEP_ID=MMETSP1397-20131031/9877_1 /ASSEMBLY_ACC=CAM_ASM_000891 /TAXON_ID=49980 /ORGANISM="Climacostomum Climacostomum virens, Strain Stock W-24" /LENGTH=1318 /DNA_ID=CAMNT_0052082157 /DNA_START=2525 /DNA_END=6481 /DNA_ORIENTATION=-